MKKRMNGLILLLLCTVAMFYVSACTKSEVTITDGKTSVSDTSGLYLNILAQKAVKSGDTTLVQVTTSFDQYGMKLASGVELAVTSPVAGVWFEKSTVTTDEKGQATLKLSYTIADPKLTEKIIPVIFKSTTKDVADTASIKFTSSSVEVNPNFLVITAEPYTLKADGKDQSKITVKLKDDNFNPIAGKLVKFRTTAGDINASATTDETGSAIATLTSEKRNYTAKVIIMLAEDTTLTDSVEVAFTGVTIKTTSSQQSIVPNNGDTAVVTGIITDGADLPIYNERIYYSKKANSTLTIIPVDSFSNTSGKFTCKVVGKTTSTTLTSDEFTISGGGYDLVVPVNYSSSTLKFDPVSSPVYANGTDTTTVRVRYVAADQTTGIPGAKVSLNVSSGTDVYKDTVTNSTGYATIRFVNPNFATTVTVTATATSGAVKTTDTLSIYFASGAANSVVLSGTPEVISTGGEKAQLKAVVKDAKGNAVKGETVSFKLLSGPGAGEHLNPATAITDESGVAVTEFVSGTATSGQQGIKIVAKTSNGKVSDTIPLTISGDPYSVKFTRDIAKVIRNANGTYSLNCAAVVMDENGNVVADGLPVQFSLEVAGYYCYKKVYTTVIDTTISGTDTTYKTSVVESTVSTYHAADGINPVSAVLINKTIPTVKGISDNMITYGMSDALRLQIRVWAEVKGITSGKMEFMLPIVQDDAKYLDLFENGGFACD